MNKKFIAISALIALIVVFFSFGVKNLALRKTAGLGNAADLKNKETLRALIYGYKKDGEYLKARAALREFIAKFSDAKESAQAEKDMEEININLLFSDVITDESLRYEIKPGDTLVKIASEHGTTVELLKKSNGLKTDTILPGRFLKVNNVKFKILVNKSDNTLTLRKETGETVKTYSISTGENMNTPTGTFRIEEKMISPAWYKVGAVVPPDSPDYELGTRWMGLSVEGYGIHGTNDAASIGKHITKGCVRMLNKDVEELYAIVPSGTEVTIVE